jgi:hypothetical protein
MNGSVNQIFLEVQRPRHWYYWAFLVFLVLLTWSMAIFQLLLGVPVGNNPAEDWLMILILIFAGVLFPIFLLLARLTVEVRKNGLFVRYSPLHLHFINVSLETVIDAQTVTFSPLGDFGGWGIRYGEGGKAYTMNGNRGIRLTYADGHWLLIGSLRSEELEMAIRTIWKKK